MAPDDVAARLRDQGMPSGEIYAVLEAREPEVVHRYLELQAERLQERLEEQRRSLEQIERLLVETILSASK